MESVVEQLRKKFSRQLGIESPSERCYQPEVFEPPPLWWYDHDTPVFKKPHFTFEDLDIGSKDKEQENNNMGVLQNLGRKCDASDCRECPAYFYIHEGGGRQIEENCVSVMRHKQVARAMWQWIEGHDWNTEELLRTFYVEEEDDCDPFA